MLRCIIALALTFIISSAAIAIFSLSSNHPYEGAALRPAATAASASAGRNVATASTPSPPRHVTVPLDVLPPPLDPSVGEKKKARHQVPVQNLTDPRDVVVVVAMRREKNNLCTPSTNMTLETSSASPLASDCRALVNNIRGGGDWTFVSGTQRTIASKGTCAFGVETQGLPVGGVWVRFGNGDLEDAVEGLIGLQEEVEDGGDDKKVGGKGWAFCPEKTNTFGPVVVMWGLYHTK